MPQTLAPSVYETGARGSLDEYYFTADNAMSPRSGDDFPTPKARLFDITPQPSPRFLCPPNPTRPSFNRASRADSDFDSLYDVTDDEAEVPLHASASVKKVSGPGRRVRFPSLIIPSPTAWPTIEKLKSATSAVPMTPTALLTPSRRVLEMINSHNLRVPGHSAAPSLDGSLTSEELDKLSCPATPDARSRRDSFSTDGSWAPMQLDYQAMHTLQHLGESAVDNEDDQETPPAEPRAGLEMQQISRPSLGLTIPFAEVQTDADDDTPISAISVPSPGGFFSSLRSDARSAWSMSAKQTSIPNTSTAEKFYDLPWENHKSEPMPALPGRRLTLSGETLDGLDEVMAAARPTIFSPVEENVEVREIKPSEIVFQYNENYHAELQKISSVNLEMTGRWLEEQDELATALRGMGNISSPSLSSSSHSRGNSLDRPVLKKSVTFAEDLVQEDNEDEEPKKIQTYVQGLEYIRAQCEKKDTFIHRQTRAEAMHLQRRCNPAAHRDQLVGKFELNEPERPAPARPVSEFYVNDPTALKERIARAQTERQALDQILPGQWVMQAQRQLNGGKLLGKPAARCITRATSPRILDVGGVATNDWAWNVAYDYPYASVVTVNTAGNNLSPHVVGPDNHKYTCVPNLWTLPFPNAHFDVISARTLYELLKTNKPAGRSSDEYDLCLKELHRCLKPGGILEFSLLDAEVMRAGRNAQAMGVEFAFNLKTRGYDAQASKSFLPRVSKAGFRDVQRAWMVLPMGQTAANWKEELNVGAKVGAQEKCIGQNGEVELQDAPLFGSTKDAAMLTGIVGSWAWERWMLRLQMEMGKEEERLLEGVVQVLEEGAKEGSAWRSLNGWARK
ncbi:methyltransferase domain-containing protein [Stagonosporopsis vannaccii]|nr:methyltransferase domain-containing protein [Stagonosporopsis vannaccii]